MSEISRTALFGKLNRVGYQAIESATVFCKLRGNPYVELVHWFQQLIQLQDSDLARILRHFGVDESRLAQDVTRSLDALPRGSTSISDLSGHIDDAVERAWVFGTLMFGDTQARSGHLVVGILKTKELRRELLSISSEFEKVKLEVLTDEFRAITAGSSEDGLSASDGFRADAAPGESSDAIAPAEMGRQEALAQFTTDLTEKARQGKIDPIVGRDEEIRQLVDILMRRRQNNPMITGEAGVGKTALVDGFALRIAAGDVPPPLQNVSLRALDVGMLQAGASMKGEFENRLKKVIEEVQASEQPIILFIDEAHTLVGAGGAAGTGDAANLLKPALARGALRTIGATTWSEYRKHIEKDPALTRRFQPVSVEEPSEAKAILMMRAMASTLEEHHRVQLMDESIEAAVRLSHRYIPARQLPDKSLSLIDTACARVAISQHATPAEVEDCVRTIESLEVEIAIIGREEAIGVDVGERRSEVEARLEEAKTRRVELQARWDEEKQLVERILELRRSLRGVGEEVDSDEARPDEGAGETTESVNLGSPDADVNAAERDSALAELRDLQKRLAEAQGESPLILPSVDEQAVSSVVADWTGIPVGSMVQNEIAAVLNLAKNMGKRVIGQDHALEMIARRIQTSRAHLDNPGKPVGTFLLVGPSGVGKTETAITLAETLYGGEQNLITINMSEFQEAHTVSTLKGSPPGYVGYGEGGVLTEAVRRRPYSVVLLDEVEKAHPDVHEIFFQVFDKGLMEDGEGRQIDFKNTLILLACNVASDLIMNLCKDPELLPSPEGMAKAMREPLLEVFPAALLGRMVAIPYYPLSDEMIAAIARLQLGRIQQRVVDNHKVPFSFDDSVIDLVASRCTELETGARMIDSILTNTVLPRLSKELLTRTLEGREVKRVHLSVENDEFDYSFD